MSDLQDVGRRLGSFTRQATRSMARRVRHAPGIRSLSVWDAIRPQYYRFLNAGRGVDVNVSGRVRIPMPADLTTTKWEEFEPRSVAAFADWIEAHPTAVVLDLGSSVGIYSAIALALSPVSEVFAFDSDLTGLRVGQNLAERLHAGARLHCLHGLVTDAAEHTTLRELEVASARLLDALPPEPDATKSAFVNLDSDAAKALPRHTLDDLFAAWDDRRPVLLKIDIEGAELLALRGAAAFIARHRPTICLSVHPWLIEKYSGSVTDLSALLSTHGYEVTVIEKDWEEHWWCEPRC